MPLSIMILLVSSSDYVLIEMVCYCEIRWRMHDEIHGRSNV